MIEYGVRHDITDLFEKTDILDTSITRNHTPFVAIHGNTVFVVNKLSKLLRLPDETTVLWQWRGQHRSDYFTFTVEQIRTAVKARGDGE